MVSTAKIQHLFPALGRCPAGMQSGNGWRIDQASFTARSAGLASTMEAGAANPKTPTSRGNVAGFLSVAKFPKLAL